MTGRAASGPSAAQLALGTVQFGLPYGAVPQPRIGRDAVAAILDAAWREGIELLDTAAAYGDAETLIGELRPAGARFTVMTKIAAVGEPRIGAAAVTKAVAGLRDSLRRLRVDALEAVLVHHAPDLLVPGGDALYQALEAERAAGRVRRLGVSVYDAATLRAVLASYPVEIVQLPLSLLDQRLLAEGMLTDLARRGIEVHARSVFLQGALLAEPEALPARFAPLRDRLDRLRVACTAAGLSAAAAALGFVARCPGVARVVIGVDSAAQLRANAAALRDALRAAPLTGAAAYACEDPAVVDPRRWIP